MLAQQFKALSEDLPPKAAKIGMLFSKDYAVQNWIKHYDGPVICDPVMVATSGEMLLRDDARHFLIGHIFPCVYLLTPNLYEAEALVGKKLTTPALIEEAAQNLLGLGPKNVLIKGGDGAGPYCHDFWTNGEESLWISHARVNPGCNHGAGCSLSAAITAHMANGENVTDAIIKAKMYVTQGIRLGEQYGGGPACFSSSLPSLFVICLGQLVCLLS